MKKLFVMAAMVLSSVGAFAQYEGGEFTLQPKVGFNASTIKNFPGSLSANTRPGFSAGVEGEYHIHNWLGVSAGVLYSQQGVEISQNSALNLDEDATLKLDYINVPILANFYVAKGLALKVGLQPGFLVSDKISLAGVSMNWNEFGNKIGEDDAKVESFDLAMPMAIAYEFKGFCIEARANMGLTKVFKGDGRDDDKSSKNNVLQLTIGYKFKL